LVGVGDWTYACMAAARLVLGTHALSSSHAWAHLSRILLDCTQSQAVSEVPAMKTNGYSPMIRTVRPWAGGDIYTHACVRACIYDSRFPFATTDMPKIRKKNYRLFTLMCVPTYMIDLELPT
jgi:hypothetical protein